METGQRERKGLMSVLWQREQNSVKWPQLKFELYIKSNVRIFADHLPSLFHHRLKIPTSRADGLCHWDLLHIPIKWNEQESNYFLLMSDITRCIIDTKYFPFILSIIIYHEYSISFISHVRFAEGNIGMRFNTHEFTQVLVVLSEKMSLFMYNFTSSKQKEATKASSSEITSQSRQKVGPWKTSAIISVCLERERS